jgi:uncharacterized repeat protein (TIGR03803 family)
MVAVALSTVAAGCASSNRYMPSGPSANVKSGESHAASSPAFSLIHAFDKQDRLYGVSPLGGVIVDAAGNIFGTASLGGASNQGLVFELVPEQRDYKIEIAHSFSCPVDGCYPIGSPAEDSQGALFANTSSDGPDGGQGTIVKLSPSGGTYRESALHTYTGWAYEPFSTPLVYGDTVYALTCDSFGILFGLTLGDLQVTLSHKFTGANGKEPLSGVVESRGVLFGTTAQGGEYDFGTVYSFEPKQPGRAETLLYSFGGGSDGAEPVGNVVLDSSGNIYGTTYQGGANNDGVVFKLTRGESKYTESILHTFSGSPDGAGPWSGLTLVGNTLWGTTVAGGDQHCNCGTIFSLSTTGGHYQVRHSFLGTDGSSPYGTLVPQDGALYGTTTAGGPVKGGAGVVFRFVP